MPVAIEDIGELPAPPPARPRTLLVATVLASVASAMVAAGIIAVYLRERAAAIAESGTWLPEEVSMPLTPANMGLVTMLMSAVAMQWAVYSIAQDDRRHTWLAFGLTLAFGAGQLNGMAFYATQMGLSVDTPQGGLIFALVGVHVVMVGAGLLFNAVMAFRTLGGRYSAKDREGVVAAALFWYATVGVYAAVWYAVFVIK